MKIGANSNSNIVYFKASQKDEISIVNLLKNLNGDRASFDISKFYTVKDGDRLIGCVRIKAFKGGCLELSSLAVDPKYQHKGIGSKLVENILTQEQSRPIFLLTSADKELFYKKFGFIIIDSQKLPSEFKEEHDKILTLPFAKSLEVIAMVVK
jgi:N-acetylglutamate synthase-like GNAT family acetyltransferase